MDNPTFHLEGIVRTRDELQDFSGPLSLILMLLSKNKIEIRDLRISDILDQYVGHIARMQQLDLDVASEFVQMASHLVYIKTRTLLAGEEEVSELEELMTSLEQLKCQDAYLSIKGVTEEFLAATMQGSLLFSKEPEPLRAASSRDYEYNHTVSELFCALAVVLTRDGRQAVSASDVLVPKRIIYNVKQKSLQLIHLLMAGEMRTLEDLFAMSSSRSEVVATFISILELCAAGSLLVTLSNGQMYISICGDGSIDLAETLSQQEALYND
jgi:segregation and condensation protein A